MIQTYIYFVLIAAAIGEKKKKKPAIEPVHVRINQAGYLPTDYKSAIFFSHAPIEEKFQVLEERTGEVMLIMNPVKAGIEGWGAFEYYYELDFSCIEIPGTYYLEGKKSGVLSRTFVISEGAYNHQQEKLLGFMRQQRCGYNPFLDMVCHQHDGRSFYGPMPDSSYVDVSGGWHDAGDQLKYLITGSYATGHMLLAYELYSDRFSDQFNALGQPGSNGIPDVLDEAKWGLDWIHKLHPSPDQLVHQVADDRDHLGWKMPDQDPSDYG